MNFLAEWESKATVAHPFNGIWRVRSVPDDFMVSCSSIQMVATTRAGLKALLRDSGNGHPVRWLT